MSRSSGFVILACSVLLVALIAPVSSAATIAGGVTAFAGSQADALVTYAVYDAKPTGWVEPPTQVVQVGTSPAAGSFYYVYEVNNVNLGGNSPDLPLLNFNIFGTVNASSVGYLTDRGLSSTFPTTVVANASAVEPVGGTYFANSTVGWTFSPTLASGAKSAVLFIASPNGPQFLPSQILGLSGASLASSQSLIAAPTPEPGSLILALMALPGLALVWYLRRK